MVQQAVREILEKKGEAEAKLFQNLYAYQERLMHAVRHGEENIDFEGMDPIGNPYFLALSRPGLRNRKNHCIVYITLAAENAIAGGMELQERLRLGLEGKAAIEHYNAWMKRYHMEHLIITEE